MKRLCTIGSVATVFAFSVDAFAQSSFGKPLDVALGIERAFGFYCGKAHIETDSGAEFNHDSQGFSLGFGHTVNAFPVYTARFAFDIFVIESLSVGAGVGFVSQDNEDNYFGDGRGGFIFAPRVGYFIDFSKYFGFWPRGGFTFFDLDDPDQSQLMLTLEGNFTFAPREGFGFMFGPAFDLGFSGEYGDADLREQSFGIVIGMFGWI